MQAHYYEIETIITHSRCLYLQIPENIPLGKARIAIIYEAIPQPKHFMMAQFLATLLDTPTKGLSKEEISNYIEHERESWES